MRTDPTQNKHRTYSTESAERTHETQPRRAAAQTSRELPDYPVPSPPPLPTAYVERLKNASNQQPAVTSAQPEAPSLAEQVQAAAGRVDAQMAEARKLNEAVNSARGQLGSLQRFAEITVGSVGMLGAGSNLVAAAGRSIVTGDSAPLVEAAERAGDAAEYVIDGAVTSKLEAAKSSYAQFSREYIAYDSSLRQYKSALLSQDHRAIVALSKQVNEQGARVAQTALRFMAQVEVAARHDKRFDAAAHHAAVHVAVTAATAGLGGMPGEHTVHETVGKMAGKVAGSAAQVAYSMAMEGAATHAASHATH